MAATFKSKAIKNGRDDGQNAAEWWIQDNLTTNRDARYAAARTYDGIENGDPEVLDTLPYLDLSGQWADGATERDILDAIVSYDLDRERSDDQYAAEDDLINIYRDAYDQAAQDTIYKACKAELR